MLNEVSTNERREVVQLALEGAYNGRLDVLETLG